MLGVPESVSGTQPGGGPIGGRTMGGDRGVVGGFFLRVNRRSHDCCEIMQNHSAL